MPKIIQFLHPGTEATPTTSSTAKTTNECLWFQKENLFPRILKK
jgi:hypothetical protein